MDKVKNHSELRKCPKTGALINVNTTDIQRAKRAKKKIKERDEAILDLQTRLERLEKLLENR